MAAGQAVVDGVLDVAAIDAVCNRLAAGEQARHGAYASQLRDALELQRLLSAAGQELSTTAELALVWRCSERRAAHMLAAAQLLGGLSGALEALSSGLLTTEQSWKVVEVLTPVPADVAATVWHRLQPRLASDAAQGVMRPPARLADLLRSWVAEADPDGAAERRRQAEQVTADVTYRKRDDGLVDLLTSGVTGPNAEACLTNIARKAQPFGAGDERTAGERRRDAVVDLLTGRDALSFGAGDDGHADAAGGRCEQHALPTCGCPLGSAVPCGAQVVVLVPLATALGLSDVPAEQVGFGPLDRDLLAQLLLSSPELRAVLVDDAGVPVADVDRVERPPRRDPQAVREALLRLATAAPGGWQPRHGDDHPVTELPDPTAARHGGPPDDTGPPGDARPGPVRPGSPGILDRPHPVGTPGRYSVPSRLRRFLQVRAPRCEWPGCGARAVRCDVDHDVAWPFGPTCACNCGPLCRRHHRVKQLGWIKTRTVDGVRWTSPTGSSWLSPSQLPVRTATTGELPAVLPVTEQLAPGEEEQERWLTDPADPWFDGLDDPWPHLGRDPDEIHWLADLDALRRCVSREAAGRTPRA